MTIEHRLERLEQENRRLKRIGLLALTAIAAVLLMGQVRPTQVIEAEGFVVKDKRGIVIATFGASYPVGSDVGFPELYYYNYLPDGRQSSTTMFKGGMGEEGLLQLQSPNGGTILLLTGQPGYGPRISISDSSGVLWSAP